MPERIGRRGVTAHDLQHHLVLTDVARHAVEVGHRRDERLHRAAVASLATVDGLLADLRDHGAVTTVVTLWDRVHRGSIVDLGADHVVIDRGSSVVAIRTRALAAVMPAPESASGPNDGDSPLRSPTNVLERLERWCGQHPVAIATGGRDPLWGELCVVGEDVVTVAPSVESSTRWHLPVEAIVEVHVDQRAAVALDGHPPAAGPGPTSPNRQVVR